MKLLDYNKVLQDFQYKPNWAFAAYEYEDKWYIRVMMMVENSRRPWQRWVIEPYRQDNDGNFYADNFARMPPVQTFAGYSPSREVVEVTGNYPIPPITDEMTFVRWMVDTIEMMEKHETDEWARYQGVLLDDPHKEVK